MAKRQIHLVAAIAQELSLLSIRLVSEDVSTAQNDEHRQTAADALVTLLDPVCIAYVVEQRLKILLEGQVFVAEKIGLSAFGMLECATDRFP